MTRLVRESIHGLFAGTWLGAVIGGAEAIRLIGDPSVSVGVDLLFSGAVAYGVFGALIGAVAGLVCSALQFPPFNQPGAGVGAALSAVGGFFGVFYLRTVIFQGFPPGLDRLQDMACVGVAVLGAAIAMVYGFSQLYGKRVWASGLAATTVLILLGGLTSGYLYVQGARDAPAPGPDALDFANRRPSLPADRPNTLFIVVDWLRPDFVGPYNGSVVDTPGLRRFAQDAVRFDQAVASSSATAPAMASLLTGRSPLGLQGLLSSGNTLSKQVVTLFEVQQSARVVTGAVLSNPELSQERGFRQGFDYFVLESAAFRTPILRSSDLDQMQLIRVLNQVRRALDNGDGPRRRGRPGGPDPMEPAPSRPAPEVFADARRFVSAARDTHWSLVVQLGDLYGAQGRPGQLLAGAGRSAVDRYRAEVALVDDEIGRFLGWLEAQGLYDRTLVVITASHGVELGEHGAVGSGTTLFEEVVHVPLLVKRASRIGGGTRHLGQVRAFDAFVTAVLEQGLELPPGVEGTADGATQSLFVDLDLGEEEDRIRDACMLRLFSEDRPAFMEVRVGRARIRGVRQEGYKLVQASDDNPRGLPAQALYDVLSFPPEAYNLSGSRDGPCEPATRVEKRLEKLLEGAPMARGGGRSASEGREPRSIRDWFRSRNRAKKASSRGGG